MNPFVPTPLTKMKRDLVRIIRHFLVAWILVASLGAQAVAIFTNLVSFAGTNGGRPVASLVQGNDGNLYGTTEYGGTNNYGTVFEISTNGILTSLYSFTYGADGAWPQAGLLPGSEGDFYGVTQFGSTNDSGALFRIDTNGALTILTSFSVGNDGANPEAALIQGRDGNLYGTTPNGGTNYHGTVFEITTNGTLVRSWSFVTRGDNEDAEAGLMQGSDGSFYGTTPIGGAYARGTVFKIDTNGTLTNLYTFTGGTDGSFPGAPLIQLGDGYLYGTTSEGGTNGYGAVFKVSSTGTLTSLYSFQGGSNGSGPQASLVVGSDGNLYGATAGGGIKYYGTIFEITTNGLLTTLHEFAGGAEGYEPMAGLIQGSDGSFYGTTEYGGTNNQGTVFRLTIGAPATPVLQSIVQTNGMLTLTWSTETGSVYQVQYTSELGGTNWTNLGGTITATGMTMSATDSVTNNAWRFYRVALVP